MKLRRPRLCGTYCGRTIADRFGDRVGFRHVRRKHEYGERRDNDGEHGAAEEVIRAVQRGRDDNPNRIERTAPRRCEQAQTDVISGDAGKDAVQERQRYQAEEFKDDEAPSPRCVATRRFPGWRIWVYFKE